MPTAICRYTRGSRVHETREQRLRRTAIPSGQPSRYWSAMNHAATKAMTVSTLSPRSNRSRKRCAALIFTRLSMGCGTTAFSKSKSHRKSISARLTFGRPLDRHPVSTLFEYHDFRITEFGSRRISPRDARRTDSIVLAGNKQNWTFDARKIRRNCLGYRFARARVTFR